MPFLFHLDNDLMVSDFDMATIVNELLVEGLGGAAGVPLQVGGKYPVQVVSENADCEVEINLNHHRRGYLVEVEEFYLFGNGFLHEPSSGIFPYDFFH